MGTQLRDGNVGRMGMIQITLTPALIAANTSAQQLFTVPGLAVGDFVLVSKPTTTAGVHVGGERVTAANQIGLTFGNHTAGGLTPPAEVYTILWFRPEVGNPAVLPGVVQV